MLNKFRMTIDSNCLTTMRSAILPALIFAIATAASVISAAAQGPPQNHVTICHRTGSASNPYIQISPDAEGVVSGHLDHDQIGNGLGGDIIPVFMFEGRTYSKNLDTDFGNGVTGEMILANGCEVPAHHTPTPTPSATQTPPMTATPTPPPPTLTPTPPVPVPESNTLILLGTGLLLGLGAFSLRKFIGRG